MCQGIIVYVWTENFVYLRTCIYVWTGLQFLSQPEFLFIFRRAELMTEELMKKQQEVRELDLISTEKVFFFSLSYTLIDPFKSKFI